MVLSPPVILIDVIILNSVHYKVSLPFELLDPNKFGHDLYFPVAVYVLPFTLTAHGPFFRQYVTVHYMTELIILQKLFF